MGRAVGILRATLPILVLVGAGLMVKAMLDSREEPEKLSSPPPAPLVRAMRASSLDVTYTVMSQGDVMAPTESRLIPRVSGPIDWVAPEFVVGGFFRQGDVLLRLDRRDHELAVVEAAAKVAAAELALAREQSEAAVARAEWEALGEGEASPLVLRVPHLAEARAGLAAARAAAELAQLNLDRTELRAPFDGRVRTRSADLGQMVSPTTELATLYAIDRAEVRLPVPHGELEFLDLPPAFYGQAAGLEDGRIEGPQVRLTARFAGHSGSWQGRLVRMEGEVDRSSRMVHLVVSVDDPYGRLQEVPPPIPLALGLFVSAEIRGREKSDVLVLPRSAMRPNSQVFVVDDEGRLRFRTVQVARIEGEQVVLASGIEDGEQICVGILETPVDGMSVRVEQATSSGLPAALEIKP